MIDNSIQKTIAICWEYYERTPNSDFPTLDHCVAYAEAVYLGPHRNIFRLFDKYMRLITQQKEKSKHE